MIKFLSLKHSTESFRVSSIALNLNPRLSALSFDTWKGSFVARFSVSLQFESSIVKIKMKQMNKTTREDKEAYVAGGRSREGKVDFKMSNASNEKVILPTRQYLPLA